MEYTILNIGLDGNRYKLDAVLEILNNIANDTPINFCVSDGVFKASPCKTLVIAYDMILTTEQVKRMCLQLNQEAIAVWWDDGQYANGDLIYNPFVNVVTCPFEKSLFIFDFSNQEPDKSESSDLPLFEQVYKFGDKVQDKFIALIDVCYSDESCDMFDVHHDNLFYQIQGIGQSLFELQDTYGAGEEVDESELRGYLGEFKRADKLATALEKHLKLLRDEGEFEWIYC